MTSRFGAVAALLSLLLLHVACGSDDASSSAKSDRGTDGGGTVDAGPAPNPDIVTTTRETLTVNGTVRSYTLAVPVSYDASKKYPLVLALHGDGGDGASMQASGPYELTSKQDAIVAYPSGQNQAWDLFTPVESNPDIQFLMQLVPAIASKYFVDQQRVLGFGYSSGAFMVNQLACKVDGLLRAIAPNEGGAPADDPNATTRTCPGRAVATFVFHGEADRTVDIGSGEFEAQFWGDKAGCAMEREDIDPAPPCQRQKGCPAATPVTICRIPGQDHIVWNRAAEVSWKYFVALP